MDVTGSTRSAILARLRHGAMTVGELARALGVTRNAVLLPLTELEAKRLVRRAEARRTGRAGKPAQRFEISPEDFERSSPAYQAIAPHLLAVLARPDRPDLAEAMRAVGRRIHDEVSGGAGPVGLDAALGFLSRQGAAIEVRDDPHGTLVLSHSCPIGALVRVDRCICSAIAAFLQDACGVPAASDCLYEEKLTCRFRLRGLTPSAPSRAA